MGQGVPYDKEQAVYWLTQAANQGEQYAKFFLSLPKTPPGGTVDRKPRQEIQELKAAMDHRPDGHDEQQYGGWNMTME